MHELASLSPRPEGTQNRQFRPTAERLANWLLREMEPEGRMRLPLRQAQARRPSRHDAGPVAHLRDAGAHGVDAHGREIVVTDMIALKELARPDPLIDDPWA